MIESLDSGRCVPISQLGLRAFWLKFRTRIGCACSPFTDPCHLVFWQILLQKWIRLTSSFVKYRQKKRYVVAGFTVEIVVIIWKPRRHTNSRPAFPRRHVLRSRCVVILAIGAVSLYAFPVCLRDTSSLSRGLIIIHLSSLNFSFNASRCAFFCCTFCKWSRMSRDITYFPC